MSIFQNFSNHRPWGNVPGPSSDVVLSSRIRLARNVVDIPFPARANKETQRQLIDQVLSVSKDVVTLTPHEFVDLTSIKKIERQFLMERHLISPEMVGEDKERGVLLAQDHYITIMLNEEDHLRLQSFEPGLALESAWLRANAVDNALGEKLLYAFDSEWGYCTSCPTNAGTGLRASCLLHLPSLVMHQSIERIFEELANAGVTARGFYGERSKAVGDLFQLSNSTSLGQTEEDFIRNVERVVHTVARYERQSREDLLNEKNRTNTEDDVYRSWGILLHARSISYDEAMQLLSRVRLGQQLGFEVPVRADTLEELMIATQPAHVQLTKGSPLRAEERDRFRATLIREKLKG